MIDNPVEGRRVERERKTLSAGLGTASGTCKWAINQKKQMSDLSEMISSLWRTQGS